MAFRIKVSAYRAREWGISFIFTGWPKNDNPLVDF